MAAKKHKLVNPFTMPGKWYKVNLHTHTTTSDGKLEPQERVNQYREAGYHALALTDHWKTNDCATLKSGKMLLISGLEFHPACPTHPINYHLVGLNVKHGFTTTVDDDANTVIEKIRAGGGEVFLGHPSWCGHGYDNFRNLKNLVAIEVYNATCDRAGRASSESEYGIMLDHEQMLPCLGVDDAHAKGSDDVLQSWTWLKMPELTVKQVLKALRSGACYASRGPRIHHFDVKDNRATIRCTPVKTIHIVGAPGQGGRFIAEPGKLLRSGRLELKKKFPYVRAVVTDEHGCKAWTGPIKL